MLRRATGLETEYGVFSKVLRGDDGGAYDQAQKDHVDHLARALKADGRLHRTFTRTGGRIYYDMGHAEGATPECGSIDELLDYDRAIGKQLQRILSTDVLIRHSEAPGVSWYVESFGAHENYQVKKKGRSGYRTFVETVPHLRTHRVSSLVYTGAGSVLGSFQISQKAPYIHTMADNSSTLQKRGLFCWRDECDEKEDIRLHLIGSEANMNENVTALKVGTMKAVLDMIERGEVPKVEVVDPLKALSEFSEDPDLKVKARVIDGRELTAIEIQRDLLDQYRDFLRRNPEVDEDGESGWLVQEWGAVLDDLTTGEPAIYERLDWPLKRHYYSRLMANGRKETRDEDVLGMELQFHRLGPRGLRRVAERSGEWYRSTKDEDVRRAMVIPPNTRAMHRGMLVATKRDYDGLYLNWKSAVRLDSSGSRAVAWVDPLNTYEESLPDKGGRVLEVLRKRFPNGEG